MPMRKGMGPGVFGLSWDQLGAMFANEDSETQAEFFRAMCREMMSWPTAYCRSMQAAAVYGLLSEDDRNLLLEFLEDR